MMLLHSFTNKKGPLQEFITLTQIEWETSVICHLQVSLQMFCEVVPKPLGCALWVSCADRWDAASVSGCRKLSSKISLYWGSVNPPPILIGLPVPGSEKRGCEFFLKPRWRILRRMFWTTYCMVFSTSGISSFKVYRWADLHWASQSKQSFIQWCLNTDLLHFSVFSCTFFMLHVSLLCANISNKE